MKTFFRPFLSVIFLVSLASVLSGCDDDETYGKKKEKERNTIHAFLNNGVCIKEDITGDTILYVKPIKVIDEDTFAAQDSTTNLEENEYVLLSKTGIYMQILSKGVGEKLKDDGKSVPIYNRYIEYNIAADSIQTRNNSPYYIAIPEEMTCTNSYGNYSGTFISGVMKNYYNKAAVPEGWLVPLQYINLGRRTDQLALVRLIVPHSSGQDDAQQYVYACFYEISYQRGR